MLLAAASPSPSGAAGDEPGPLPPRPDTTLRLCDPTGCYVAWGAVDSDHDGVSDADEIVAGTDPHDPLSSPHLEVVVEIAADRGLPTFENGLGAFVALPDEIMQMERPDGDELLGAFALPVRKDALSRMGISTDLLSEHGLSIEGGFTLGLDGPGSEGSPAPVRVGGIDISLVSAGAIEPPNHSYQQYGGVKNFSRQDTNHWSVEYHDGSRDDRAMGADGSYTSQHTNPDGSAGNTTYVEQSGQSEDGGGWSSSTTETVVDAAGNTVSTTTTDTRVFGDGSVTTSEVKTEVQRDGNGNAVGTTITTSFSYISADGNTAQSATVVQSCDAGGENCSEVSSEYTDTDDEEYVNPDADTTAVVTVEMVDGVLRTRGAAVTVVDGWQAPEADTADVPDPGLVALVDTELAAHYLVLDPPRVTETQPEGRPDLPNPGDAAPSGPGTGCNGLC
jgi:hypothetical protein